MSQDLSSEGASRIARFSLDRRVTVLVLFVTTLVVGLIAALGIPIELIPRGFEEPFLGVVVPWRDAPPREVEQKVTLPLEEELSGIQGLETMSSYSRAGQARVWLRFKQGTEMNVAYREVRDRVDRARARLPEDANRTFIRKHDDSGIPVAVYGLAVDPSLTDIYNLIQNEVVLPLSRIDGVASVQVDGLEEKEILIELDRAKTQAAGLNVYELGRELAGDNFTLASGTVEDGARTLMLRSVARYASLEALEARPVGGSGRLRDVAEVRYDEPEKRYRVRVNSLPAFAVVVLKEGQANTMDVSRRLNAAFEAMKTNPRMQKIFMLPLFVQGDVIRESLDTLVQSGEIGGLFAVAVLFVFLRRLRMTAIITLSIPLSIVVGLTVMYFAGDTLNILSLLGLMICVGLLVDNSVVVAENIHRLHRLGLDRRTACLAGASEIALAITTATLTTIVVFLPVALVDGPGQFFLLKLAIPIGVSLSASLFVALVFVPLAVYLTLPERADSRPKGRLKRLQLRLDGWLDAAYAATLERVNQGYLVCLRFFLHRRLDLVLALLAVFALSIAAAKGRLEVTEQQENERSGFEIDVELPAATTLAEAEQYFEACERVLEARKSELGLQGYFIFHRATEGDVEGWFTNPRTTKLTPREVTQRLLEALPKRPGVSFHTGDESELEESKGKNTFVLPLHGDDFELVDEVGDELEETLAALPGVLGSKRQAERTGEELALVVDRERARRHGVTPAVVAGVVSYALRGSQLPRYHQDGRQIPVRVRFREADRQGLDELAAFEVPTLEGGVLPVSSVTEAEVRPTWGGIARRNKRVTRSITLELEEGTEAATREMLEAFTAAIDLPEGVAIGVAEGQRALDEDLAAMLFAGLLSIVFIYLLMGVLFESFILPLSILVTIPLAGIGVILAHLALGLDIDFLGVVGGVLLVGVVVNNGIVLVDYLNRLRLEGHARDEAVLLAAERRFRPIMMTALTTIIGMIPLTLGGSNSIGWSYTSFGLTLIGGMSTATFLTLLVVPVFYTAFEDGWDLLKTACRRALRPRVRLA